MHLRSRKKYYGLTVHWKLVTRCVLITVLLIIQGISTLQSSPVPDLMWEKAYGGSHHDIALSIQQTNDGGYIIAGQTRSDDGDVSYNPSIFGGFHDTQIVSSAWIVKTDMQGSIEWENTYGGSSRDYAYSIQQTADSGYIVAGKTRSYNDEVWDPRSAWVIKLDKYGEVEWENTYDTSGRALSIQQTTDEGYIVTGNGNWVAKLNSDGTVRWEKSFGEGIGKSVRETADKGYIITFTKNMPVFHNVGVIKLDQDGAQEWERTYGGSAIDWPHAIQQTTDGGYIVAGSTESDDGDVSQNPSTNNPSSNRRLYKSIWLLKLDAAGNLQWENTYGGSESEYATSIQQTSDGGYIVAGPTRSDDGDVSVNPGYSSFWIIKLNEEGSIVWEQTYGGSYGELAQSIQQTTDGGYIVAGGSGSDDGDVSHNPSRSGSALSSFWVVKLSRELYLGPDTTICKGDSLVLEINTYPGETVEWSTGETGDHIVVREEGTYSVTVTTEKAQFSDTIEVSVAPRSKAWTGPGEKAFCGNIDHALEELSGHSGTVEWQVGDTSKTLYKDDNGKLILHAETSETCSYADTTKIAELDHPESMENEEQKVCESETHLDGGNPGADYEWNTGETTRTISISESGLYRVKLSNAYCSIEDSTMILLNEESECPYLWMPNAFSPNDDQLNDVFKPVCQNIDQFNMRIYDRWGSKLYETSDISEGWDGTVNSTHMPEGEYVYIIDYEYKKYGVIKNEQEKGVLHLIR